MISILQRYRFLLLLVFAFFLLSFQMGNYALMDLDEPRYAEAAREMINRQDYIVPYFNEVPRYDKPILFYWAEILSFKAFGVSEWAARLPSVLAALGLIACAYSLGSFTSAILLTTSLEFFIMARMSVTDMLLTLCMSAALVFFYKFYEVILLHDLRSRAWRSNVLLYFSALMMAFGVLCKGPVALALPVLVIFVFLLYKKQLLLFLLNNWSLILKALVLFLLISLPWYITVHQATAGEFTNVFFFKHNLERFSGTLSGHHGAWYFYLPVIVIGALPWSLFLPKIFLTKKSDIKVFALIWFLVFTVFYSLAATKLINYILPVYLPLMILITLWLKDNLASKYLQCVYLGFLILGIIFLILVNLPYQNFTNEPFIIHCIDKMELILSASSIIIIGFIIQCIVKHGRFELAFWSFVFGVSLVLLMLVPVILMPLAKFKAEGIQKFTLMIPAQAKLVSIEIERPSFTYYAKRVVDNIRLSELLATKQELYFVIKQNMGKQINCEHQILFEDDKYIYSLKPAT